LKQFYILLHIPVGYRYFIDTLCPKKLRFFNKTSLRLRLNSSVTKNQGLPLFVQCEIMEKRLCFLVFF